ncbi:hypothetical protein conserved [Leishmania donovani]|uniref:Uncharacterized protein n=3 Tax=Leishmania donovani species complex TaxID=38574 RepID=E9AGA4_LEIIN|nr:conserved hypothetical protein [Leishmania infantum JPCM5]XP_003859119.1 uncharacterized protein LDBPK_120075 [Leishmania donovani]CAC9462330.1 hypothetical_protein_-_conserved [Leishmania infantum]AYU76917.1 hypothetical protein LdCL_120005800 [Leishmania donovani]CAJ1986974.1 hypothetical protein conserved [Leishmania donovani]CBZ08404.1 conserved hypothetical protein [Leishmania infantum JPCM5]CBZ32407.1 unnamed protein product [Leishmania donovani]|eukprot:XP_003392256.1 conserved hypothetical protein [Leishmania infantum JPCM5]
MDLCGTDVVPFQGVRLGTTPTEDFYLTTLEKKLLRMSAMEQLRACCFADPPLPTARDGGEQSLLWCVLSESVRVFLSLMLFLCLVAHLLN